MSRYVSLVVGTRTLPKPRTRLPSVSARKGLPMACLNSPVKTERSATAGAPFSSLPDPHSEARTARYARWKAVLRRMRAFRRPSHRSRQPSSRGRTSVTTPLPVTRIGKTFDGRQANIAAKFEHSSVGVTWRRRRGHRPHGRDAAPGCGGGGLMSGGTGRFVDRRGAGCIGDWRVADGVD